jgi:FMN phosphatase YigB (HAD superfamily)
VIGLEAITLDFGNTLVPFPAGRMADVIGLTALRVAPALAVDGEELVRVWGEERQRQFSQDVPQGREADMEIRAVRALARLRGCPSPNSGGQWDDARAASFSKPPEVASILDTYAAIFVDTTPVPPEIGPLLDRLARRYAVGILSNWPLAPALERFVEAAGWSPSLRAVVISQRVGCIKPCRAIFEVAARALGVASGPALLHVGDDIGADVVGAQRVGWRAALVRVKPADSPLPTAQPAPDANPDLVIDSVLELETALDLR